ncbi:MAG: hypothetical protein IJL26_08795 [Clostridia bacterium]|nr:hypothetical protein [Clostridia bacterium]
MKSSENIKHRNGFLDYPVIDNSKAFSVSLPAEVQFKQLSTNNQQQIDKSEFTY